jgi:hypothetical protein
MPSCMLPSRDASGVGFRRDLGNWHTIYVRMNRWAKNGVLDQVFEKLQSEQLVRIRIEAFALDSTSVKVHPDGTGALKKRTASHREIVWRMDLWTTKIHLVAADAQTAITFALSPGNAHTSGFLLDQTASYSTSGPTCSPEILAVPGYTDAGCVGQLG